MSQLTIHSPLGTRKLEIDLQTSVRNALDLTDWRVRAACGGQGSCGACLVKLLSGNANPLTLAEYQKIPASERQQGWRLSCQLRLISDAEIEIEYLAHASQWRSIAAENLMTFENSGVPNLVTHPFGIAVDLGTTHLRVTLWNRKTATRIASRHGANPQQRYGSDFLHRLDSAVQSPQIAREMSELVLHAIIDAVRDMLMREVGEVSPMLAEIGQVCIVGNTAMLTLLTEQGSDELLNPAFWQKTVNCQPENFENWHKQWKLPNAEIMVLPPVSGFVGSDLASDLLATQLCESENAALLLDVGTNTEIALWTGSELLITAVPGAPAFEGIGIRNGMLAESGAICDIQLTDSGLQITTINHESARGFCGSGLVDAIAVLVANGTLKPSGRFAQPVGNEGFALIENNPHSTLTGSDIDTFQRAKAAIAAAMLTLLEQANLDWQKIERLCVCGAFGRHLNIENAQATGLLPAIAIEKVELYADASLAGCELALLCENGAEEFAQITRHARTFNLSLIPSYDDCYINQLRLKRFCSIC